MIESHCHYYPILMVDLVSLTINESTISINYKIYDEEHLKKKKVTIFINIELTIVVVLSEYQINGSSSE